MYTAHALTILVVSIATITFIPAYSLVLPEAHDQNVVTDENTAIIITLTASDLQVEPITFSIVNNPSDGILQDIGIVMCAGIVSKNCSVEVTYTPNVNFHGSDSFTFKATDSLLGDTNVATVSILVQGNEELEGQNDENPKQGLIVTEKGIVTVSVVNDDCIIDKESLRNVSLETLNVNDRLSLNFPVGLLEINLTCLSPGESVVLDLTFPSDIPAGSEYWKIINNEWMKLPSELVGNNDGDNRLTITLTDGGIGDADGEANGIIIDPGGPAIPVSSNSSPKSSCDDKILVTNDAAVSGRCVIHDLQTPKITKVFTTPKNMLCVEAIDNTGLAKITINGMEISRWSGSYASFCANDVVGTSPVLEIVATDFAGNSSVLVLTDRDVDNSVTLLQNSAIYVNREPKPRSMVEAVAIENVYEVLKQVRLTLSPNMDKGTFLLSEYALKEVAGRETVTITMNAKPSHEFRGYLIISAANQGILGILPIDVGSDDMVVRPPLNQKHRNIYFDLSTLSNDNQDAKIELNITDREPARDKHFYSRFKNMSSLHYKQMISGNN